MSEYFRKYIKKEHYPNHFTNVKFKTTFKNCVLEALRRRQWKETDGDDWDIFWAEKEWIHEVMDHVHMNHTQKVNHFRNHYELTRKDLMIKNLKRHKKALEKEGKVEEAAMYNFFPLTFHLPSEYPIFYEEFKKQTANDSKCVWIMKPIARSQGKGIFLFNKIQQISQWKNNFRYNPENPQAENYIVQRYINDPLLLGGKKFDMRIYALCTSYQPLTVYLYRTGFARFTHSRYDTEDINNTYVHLTNVAVQKTSDNYDDKLGGKWNLQTLKLFMMQKYGQEKVTEAFHQIQQMIIKSLQSVQKIIINDKHCFELYGYDVLFDAQIKPWLLEVNASPSMTANTPQDFDMKVGLLDDVFTILDLERTLTGQEEQVGGFDLIFKGNPVKLPNNSTFTSLLGAFNNRTQQLKKLAKSTAIRLSQTQPEISMKQLEPVKKEDPKQQQIRSTSKGPQSQQSQNSQLSYQSGSTKISNPQSTKNQQLQQQQTQQPQIQLKRNQPTLQQQNQGFARQVPKRNPGVNGVVASSQQQSILVKRPINQPMQQQISQANQVQQQRPNPQSFTTNQKLQQLDRNSNGKQFEPYKNEEMRYNQVIGRNENEDDGE